MDFINNYQRSGYAYIKIELGSEKADKKFFTFSVKKSTFAFVA